MAKWFPYRWWIALLIFISSCVLAIAILPYFGMPHNLKGGIIVTLMLVFIILFTISDRGWPIWIRPIWVVVAWLIHALLQLPVAFILGHLYTNIPTAFIVNGQNYLDATVSFVATIPIIIFGMYRSRYFVYIEAL